MKKSLLAVVVWAVCSGLVFAESMAGKAGLGLRNDSFDVRYFINDWLGVHGGVVMSSYRPEGVSNSSDYGYCAGSFYSKEITDGVMFQTGLTVQYHTGKDAGVGYKEWNYNPYVGAEFVYKGRFGFDFKVIPVQYGIFREAGANYTYFAGGYGSVGAHLYF